MKNRIKLFIINYLIYLLFGYFALLLISPIIASVILIIFDIYKGEPIVFSSYIQNFWSGSIKKMALYLIPFISILGAVFTKQRN